MNPILAVHGPLILRASVSLHPAFLSDSRNKTIWFDHYEVNICVISARQRRLGTVPFIFFMLKAGGGQSDRPGPCHGSDLSRNHRRVRRKNCPATLHGLPSASWILGSAPCVKVARRGQKTTSAALRGSWTRQVELSGNLTESTYSSVLFIFSFASF